MKVMAIDLGDARTGIAISDAMGWLTGFTKVIHSWNKDKTAQEIAALVKTHRPERIVMGFPKNMDGSEGPRADLYREFAAQLEELLGQPVALWPLTAISPATVMIIHTVTYPTQRKMPPAAGKP